MLSYRVFGELSEARPCMSPVTGPRGDGMLDLGPPSDHLSPLLQAGLLMTH